MGNGRKVRWHKCEVEHGEMAIRPEGGLEAVKVQHVCTHARAHTHTHTHIKDFQEGRKKLKIATYRVEMNLIPNPAPFPTIA